MKPTDLHIFHSRNQVPNDFTGTCYITNLKQSWIFLNGKEHSDDGCAVSSDCGTQKWWFKHGQLHRLDGPAIIMGYAKYWYIDGSPIEENKFNEHPLVVEEKNKAMNKTAVKTAEKILLIKSDKELPKTYTGTVRYPSGLTQKLHNGIKHCFDGPAVIFSNGIEQWWVDGIRLDPRAQTDLIDSFLKLGKKINFINPAPEEEYYKEEYPFEEMKDGWNYSSYDKAFFFIKDGKPCNPDGDPGKYDLTETQAEFWEEEQGLFLYKDELHAHLKQKKFAKDSNLQWFSSMANIPNNFSGGAFIDYKQISFKNGKIHNEDEAAVIHYDKHMGLTGSYQYWLEGKMYASKKTWETKLAKLKKEKEVTEALNSPLVKLRTLASRLAGAHDPILTENDRVPTDRRSITIHEGKERVVVRNYTNGNYHSLTDAAYIEYNSDGAKTVERYWIEGKVYKTADEWLEAVEAYKATADRAKEKIDIAQEISVKLGSEEYAKDLSKTLARRGFTSKRLDIYVSEVRKQREQQIEEIKEKNKKERVEIIARNAADEHKPKTKEGWELITDSKVIPVIKSDLSQAGKRIAAKQFLKLAKNYIVKSLSKGNSKAEANLDKFFATNQGLILLNGMMAVVLPAMETVIPENWKGLYKEICKEYRVEAMASGGELLLDAVFASNLSSLKEESEEVFEKLRVDISEEAKASEPEEVSVVASSPGGEITLN